MINLEPLKLLDVVAVTVAVPEYHLTIGQVGTVVEFLGHNSVEVEFCDDEGQTYATAPVHASQLLVLRYYPPPAA